MVKTVAKVLERFNALLNDKVNVTIDHTFDCLNVLYQVAVNVKVVENGTFRFLVIDGKNFLIFQEFAVKRHFPFSYQVLMTGEFEVFVQIPRLLVSLNKDVNRGL